jgi:hypothetical protein
VRGGMARHEGNSPARLRVAPRSCSSKTSPTPRQAPGITARVGADLAPIIPFCTLQLILAESAAAAQSGGYSRVGRWRVALRPGLPSGGSTACAAPLWSAPWCGVSLWNCRARKVPWAA